MRTSIQFTERRFQQWELHFWVTGMVFWVAGDTGTTIYGVEYVRYVYEVNPLVGPLLEKHGLVVLLIAKGLLIGVLYALWRISPFPHRIGVPIGLTLVGIVATGWNASVVLRAIFGW